MLCALYASTVFYLKKKNEYVLSKQLLRSGTSIGANVREGKNAQSKADFIHKLNIALKETDETEYWVDLLHDSQLIDIENYQAIKNDLNELISILTSSIKTLKRNERTNVD